MRSGKNPATVQNCTSVTSDASVDLSSILPECKSPTEACGDHPCPYPDRISSRRWSALPTVTGPRSKRSTRPLR